MPHQTKISDIANAVFNRLTRAANSQEAIQILTTEFRALPAKEQIALIRQEKNGGFDVQNKTNIRAVGLYLAEILPILNQEHHPEYANTICAPYIISEYFSAYKKAGDTTPIVVEVAKAVKKMNADDYRTPKKLAQLLEGIIADNFEASPKIKKASNPFKP